MIATPERDEHAVSETAWVAW